MKRNKMGEQKKTTLEYMMHYGALLGLFWIFKYMFFIGEVYWEHFIYFYHLLNVVSPLLMYIFYLKYKSETPEIAHGIWRCVLFIVGISFFASIFESAIIYAHYAFINPDLFANISSTTIGITNNMFQMMQEKGILKDVSSEQIAEIKEINRTIGTSKFPYLFSHMFNQLFMGFIFSLLIGLFTRNRS